MEANIHGHIDLNNLPEETSTDQDGHFPEEVYNNLPEWLKQACQRLTGTDKEVFFVGSLAVLSSLLPGIKANYDGQQIESNLFLFLVGNFGSGKGALSYSRQLAAPIHKHIKETAPASDPETGQPLPKKLHFLPANSSKSGFIELLANNGGRGLIFETESDSLTDILKQDYGNFSDILRRGFHHETISFYRRLNKEYFDIEKPSFSVLLSGTPNQLQKFIPGVENGLFSRFLFHQLQTNTEFKNVFDESKNNLNGLFYSIGEHLREFYIFLNSGNSEIVFKLTESQQNEFLAYFQELKTTLIDTFGEGMAGNVNRFAVQFFRIAMILSAMRITDINQTRPFLFCKDVDFKNVIRIMEVFIFHALQIFESLDQSGNDLPQNKLQFIQALPPEFATSEAVTTGQRFNISESTVKRFLRENQYFEYLRHGVYRKK